MKLWWFRIVLQLSVDLEWTEVGMHFPTSALFYKQYGNCFIREGMSGTPLIVIFPPLTYLPNDLPGNQMELTRTLLSYFHIRKSLCLTATRKYFTPNIDSDAQENFSCYANLQLDFCFSFVHFRSRLPGWLLTVVIMRLSKGFRSSHA